MARNNEFSCLLRCRRLMHQFVVDQYANVEHERLTYILNNQQTLRAIEYNTLRDAVVNDQVNEDIGQLVVLPSTFTGGPRYMHEKTQDAMVYVRNYGKPSLFITFTCNKNWAMFMSPNVNRKGQNGPTGNPHP